MTITLPSSPAAASEGRPPPRSRGVIVIVIVIVIAADIREQDAHSAAAEIAAGGGRANGVLADVGQDDCFEMLKALALDRFGRIDIVMNNAATITRGLPEHCRSKNGSACSISICFRLSGAISRSSPPFHLRRGRNTSSTRLPLRTPYLLF